MSDERQSHQHNRHIHDRRRLEKCHRQTREYQERRRHDQRGLNRQHEHTHYTKREAESTNSRESQEKRRQPPEKGKKRSPTESSSGLEGNTESKDSKKQKISFCDYCGDDIRNGDVFDEQDKTCHKNCLRYYKRRDDAVSLFKTCIAKYDNVLSMAIHVNYLYGLKGNEQDENKRRKRSNKLEELLKLVSALRNSNSGYILIHLVGLARGDEYTGNFDEFADEKLKDLIVDGSSFDDVYDKKLLSDHNDSKDLDDLNEKIKEFTDFLVLYVGASKYLVTADFRTKIALDDRIVDPSDLCVFRHLSNRKEFKEEFPQITVNILSLKENRSVQLKSYYPKPDWKGTPVSYMLEHKVLENISAFTKNKAGGSYYLGVAEREITLPGTTYKTRKVHVTPVPVTNKDKLKSEIKKQIREKVLVCDYDGQKVLEKDIVNVKVINPPGDVEVNQKIQKDTGEPFIVCVPVKPVRGIVFYDKEGPLAYRVGKDKQSVTKLELEEWFRVFMKRI